MVFLYQYTPVWWDNLSAAAFRNEKDKQSSCLLSVLVTSIVSRWQISLSQRNSLTHLPNITGLAENEADWQPDHCHLAVALCLLSVTVLHLETPLKRTSVSYLHLLQLVRWQSAQRRLVETLSHKEKEVIFFFKYLLQHYLFLHLASLFPRCIPPLYLFTVQTNTMAELVFLETRRL